MKQLLLAFQFLTIVPVRVNGDLMVEEMAQSARYFPLVGAFQGLIAISSAMVFLKVFTPEITAGLIIIILILTSGGFHLDGLADTFDALSVKSTGDRNKDIKKRLTVMKDSTTGAIGVVAIVSVILLKFLFISCILSFRSSVIMLLLMPVFSKWSMVIAMYHGTPAREDGLGRIFLNNVKLDTLLFSTLETILLCILIFIPDLNVKVSAIRLMAIFVLLYIFSLTVVRFCNKRFNGLTGDNLGALSEISEILFLMVAAAWL